MKFFTFLLLNIFIVNICCSQPTQSKKKIIKDSIAALKKKNKSLQDTIDGLEKTIDNLEKEKVDANKKYNEAISQNNTYIKKKDKLKTDCSYLTSNIKTIKSDSAKCTETLNRYIKTDTDYKTLNTEFNETKKNKFNELQNKISTILSSSDYNEQINNIDILVKKCDSIKSFFNNDTITIIDSLIIKKLKIFKSFCKAITQTYDKNLCMQIIIQLKQFPQSDSHIKQLKNYIDVLSKFDSVDSTYCANICLMKQFYGEGSNVSGDNMLNNISISKYDNYPFIQNEIKKIKNTGDKKKLYSVCKCGAK